MQNTGVQSGGNGRSVGGLTRPACVLEGRRTEGRGLGRVHLFTSLMSLFITGNMCYFFAKNKMKENKRSVLHRPHLPRACSLPSFYDMPWGLLLCYFPIPYFWVLAGNFVRSGLCSQQHSKAKSVSVFPSFLTTDSCRAGIFWGPLCPTERQAHGQSQQTLAEPRAVEDGQPDSQKQEAPVPRGPPFCSERFSQLSYRDGRRGRPVREFAGWCPWLRAWLAVPPGAWDGRIVVLAGQGVSCPASGRRRGSGSDRSHTAKRIPGTRQSC